ncbi:hypothetical protein SAMN02745221_02042 [Thermosyntropha lipolytica DSM 11003]|uniref:Thioredoxin domain-containing protein n=1 Tax=Thermosyntropha lipolytica DSM 11003 TaxID=1123382 RepID=A0A1M5RJ00_9FIRM|nr:hypothetical protein [Thermosyntropha lipolytica]SHH26126.1 hypothetical protein SAMN02745221_02042 [Thermosyntropha lipolytica DSM 11003]
MSKILVEVYAGVNAGGGCCACSGGCGIEEVKMEYEHMAKAVKEKYGDEVEVNFIDTTGKEPGEFAVLEKVIKMGYSFPFTVINGQPRLAGKVSTESVLELLEEIKAGKDN